jgi:hypothetical protein
VKRSKIITKHYLSAENHHSDGKRFLQVLGVEKGVNEKN